MYVRGGSEICLQVIWCSTAYSFEHLYNFLVYSTRSGKVIHLSSENMTREGTEKSQSKIIIAALHIFIFLRTWTFPPYDTIIVEMCKNICVIKHFSVINSKVYFDSWQEIQIWITFLDDHDRLVFTVTPKSSAEEHVSIKESMRWIWGWTSLLDCYCL